MDSAQKMIETSDHPSQVMKVNPQVYQGAHFLEDLSEVYLSPSKKEMNQTNDDNTELMMFNN